MNQEVEWEPSAAGKGLAPIEGTCLTLMIIATNMAFYPSPHFLKF